MCRIYPREKNERIIKRHPKQNPLEKMPIFWGKKENFGGTNEIDGKKENKRNSIIYKKIIFLLCVKYCSWKRMASIKRRRLRCYQYFQMLFHIFIAFSVLFQCDPCWLYFFFIRFPWMDWSSVRFLVTKEILQDWNWCINHSSETFRTSLSAGYNYLYGSVYSCQTANE